MIKILGKRVLVSRIEEVKTEEFNAVEVQDSFVYKGKVEQSGFVFANQGSVVNGSTILFAKYSPDTHEVTVDGQVMKIISVDDILAIYE